ncbi:hypothetical protein [Marinomonas sp. 2405UD68-3]|uniref:hypothetical protein n=1 Tax=Marinomonas sp. 2405UD68-3 TaxID=3391835 RepID=UPI0039C9790E
MDPLGLAGAAHPDKDDVNKKMNVGSAGHHVPAVRKSKGREFEVSRSDKDRPTLHFKGDNPSHDHWRSHDAERAIIGPRQGNFSFTNQYLINT